MKKIITYLLLLVLTLITFLPISYAKVDLKNTFNKVWSDKDKLSYYASEPITQDMIELDNSYIVLGAFNVLTAYDTKGEELWQKVLNAEDKFSLLRVSNSNDFYLLGVESGLTRYNKDGEEVSKNADITGTRLYNFKDYIVVLNGISGRVKSVENNVNFYKQDNLEYVNGFYIEYNYVALDNDNVYLLGFNNLVPVMTSSISSYNLKLSIINSELTKEEKSINTESLEDVYFDESDSIIIKNNALIDNNNFYFTNNETIYKIDLEEYKLAEALTNKSGDYNELYTTLIKSRNYYVVGGMRYKAVEMEQSLDSDNDYSYPFVNIYDKDYNLLEHINLQPNYELEMNGAVSALTALSNGFLVGGLFAEYPSSVEAEAYIGSSATSVSSFISKYIYSNKITLSVDDKAQGKVNNLAESAYEGDSVKVDATPNKGYQTKITVTDTDGNNITVTNNTFTMPNKDVTVKVEFINSTDNALDTNPKTGMVNISSLIIISGILGIGYLKYKKNKLYKI